ncbi:argininosuccinate synthetase [Clonorchis sinensis]|uniref:Arginase n=1 Tax=Clonorchis sinensis TaxID=79923 RepID=A0A8T1MEX7_CLOSI|nr:argininosuccinate synthetase [Clonorchis sinensis]
MRRFLQVGTMACQLGHQPHALLTANLCKGHRPLRVQHIHTKPRRKAGLHDPTVAYDQPWPLYSQVNMIGAPVNKGQPKPGTELGPNLIRNSNIFEFLEAYGVTLRDCGDVHLDSVAEETDKVFNMSNCQSFIKATYSIAQRVEELLKESKSIGTESDSPLLIVGGDHSIATGSILGHKRAKPDAAVIWVDAHADITTPLSAEYSNIHGMPVAFLLEELQEEVPYLEEMDAIEPCLKATDIVYIGLRDLERHEVYDLRRNGIPHFTMVDVDQMGIEAVIHKAIEFVNPRLERPIHLSFDIDAIDPTLAPSTGTPVPGGLTLREGLRICEVVHATGNLSVVELVELNPLIGTQCEVDRTTSTAVTLLKACLGYRRSGNLPRKLHSLSDEGILSRADKRKKNDHDG